MAPANGVNGSSRPAQRPVVMPAIPLPYLHRQTNSTAAAVAIPAAEIAADDSQVQEEPRAEAHGDSAKEKETMTANHKLGDTKNERAVEKAEEVLAMPSPHPTVTNGKAEAKTAAEPAVPPPTSSALPQANTQNPRTAQVPPVEASFGRKSSDKPRRSGSRATHGGISPAPRRRMPPPFHPANAANNNYHRAHQSSTSGFMPDFAQLSLMDRPNAHQPHPSNGSLIFGGFQDSNNSSPVPLSAGGFPPPGMAPYPHDGVPIPLDGYGQPMLMSPTGDGFVPIVNNHGPPTPHSYHGSHSSAPADEPAYYPAMNGYNGYAVASSGPVVLPANPQMSGGAVLSTAAPVDEQFLHFEIQGGALRALRYGFNNPDFADCFLQVRYNDPHQVAKQSNGRAPLRMPAHRLILAQSPTLHNILRSSGLSQDGAVYLEVRDSYTRTDAIHYTIRTMYGWDLLDSPAHSILPAFSPVQNPREELDLAFGYIGAARLLQLPLVHARVVSRATHLIYWETIEQASEFALPSAIFGRVSKSDQAKNGFGLEDLVHAVVLFLVSNFPKNFTLDTTVTDSGFTRLPYGSPRATVTHQGPPIARGTSEYGSASHSRQSSITASQGQLPNNSRVATNNPRLTQIKFGDLSPLTLNGANPTVAETLMEAPAVVPSAKPTPIDTTLSRILLNLPFTLLKHVLEHPTLAKESGGLSPSARHTIISAVVAEREARRLRSLDRQDAFLRQWQEKLDGSSEPLAVQEMGDFLVNNMGFKEEVFPGDAPYLVQTWIHSADGSS